jgi:hypothetical protein
MDDLAIAPALLWMSWALDKELCDIRSLSSPFL